MEPAHEGRHSTCVQPRKWLMGAGDLLSDNLPMGVAKAPLCNDTVQSRAGKLIVFVAGPIFDSHQVSIALGCTINLVRHGQSGKDTNRPQLELMMSFVRSGDTLIVHSMDRLARDQNDLHRIVQTLTGKGVRIEFIKEHLDLHG